MGRGGGVEVGCCLRLSVILGVRPWSTPARWNPCVAPGEGSFPKPDVHQLRCHLFFSPSVWDVFSLLCTFLTRTLGQGRRSRFSLMFQHLQEPVSTWWNPARPVMNPRTVNYVSTPRWCLKTCCYLLLAPGSVCSCPLGRSLLKKPASDWLISDETFCFQRSEMMLETPILALSCAEQELKEESVNWCSSGDGWANNSRDTDRITGLNLAGTDPPQKREHWQPGVNYYPCRGADLLEFQPGILCNFIYLFFFFSKYNSALFCSLNVL